MYGQQNDWADSMTAAIPPATRRRQPAPSRGMPAGGSRFSLLAASLIGDIEAGRYAVGSMLPTESELCEQFAVSRHTVREALRRLREMGLVSRHQGIGTRVKAKRGNSRYVHSIDSISDLFTYVKNTRLAIISRRDLTAEPAHSGLLRCAPGQRWLVVEVTRFLNAGILPMVASEIYIPQAYAAIGHEMQNLRVPIYTLIEEHYGQRIAEVQQVMAACAIPARKARILKVRARSPGLAITRHYLGEDDKMLLVSESLYPEGRFSYSMSLRFSWRDAEARTA